MHCAPVGDHRFSPMPYKGSRYVSPSILLEGFVQLSTKLKVDIYIAPFLIRVSEEIFLCSQEMGKIKPSSNACSQSAF